MPHENVYYPNANQRSDFMLFCGVALFNLFRTRPLPSRRGNLFMYKNCPTLLKEEQTASIRLAFTIPSRWLRMSWSLYSFLPSQQAVPTVDFVQIPAYTGNAVIPQEQPRPLSRSTPPMMDHRRAGKYRHPTYKCRVSGIDITNRPSQ